MAKNTKETLFGSESGSSAQGPVECLGMKFPNDEARRAHFTEKLRERLKDPEFRKIEGFPIGEDVDIVAMSDPPYYTACPNPFITEFLSWQVNHKADKDHHSRKPFTQDLGNEKHDLLNTAHPYPGKFPYEAILRYVLHYTEPGDVVLDGFSGSGMTGVAAQMCGCPDTELRQKIEIECLKEGKPLPRWGERRIMLVDLSPIATFISANHNIPFDLQAFNKIGSQILSDLQKQIGPLYETMHINSGAKVGINFTIWSEVFRCPNCFGDVVLFEQKPGQKGMYTNGGFPCPNCCAILTERELVKNLEARFDPAINKDVLCTKKKPILINYSVDEVVYEKRLDDQDQALIGKICLGEIRKWFPTCRMMHAPESIEKWGDNWRAGTSNYSHIHHFYNPRNLNALSLLWSLAEEITDTRNRLFSKFFVEQAIWGLSLLNCYKPTSFSQVNRFMRGFSVPSHHAECSPWYILDGKLNRLVRGFAKCRWSGRSAIISTNSCTQLPIPDKSVDYIVTDPPIGSKLAYAEANFLIEAWHRVFTNYKFEVIESKIQAKKLTDYKNLMRECFREFKRVLKPGRWITVGFHISQSAVWIAIQETIIGAGFVVADIRGIEKQIGSYRQVTSFEFNQDIVISAYRPAQDFEERFKLAVGTTETVWEFVRSHLNQVLVVVQSENRIQVNVERLPYILYDRMVAFHVQRGCAVPLTPAEFHSGLRKFFPERDGMYFLPDQVKEYELKRLKLNDVEKYEFFVNDEKSAIQWVRQQIIEKPISKQELHAPFLQKAQRVWHKYEKVIELSDILEQNFIQNSDGKWYIPNLSEEIKLEILRHRQLLMVFQQYLDANDKLEIARMEALRAGFKDAWQKKSYTTIMQMAKRVPEAMIQEDQALLMYFDKASLLKGE